MNTNVYFDKNELIVEKNGIKKSYPIEELRYKECCTYYKRPRGNIVDGRNSTNTLKLYHNNKFVAALSKKDSSFGAIIETYNLKVYAEDDFIYLRKPANLVCVQALCFWCILIFAFVYWITLIGEIGTKYYLKTGFVILIAIFDILLYKSSKFSIYYNEEEIELRYTFRKKVYTYEDVSEYKIYPSKMNNNMEMISITFSDDKTIIINQEYENYQNFSKILKEKAFTPYVECL